MPFRSGDMGHAGQRFKSGHRAVLPSRDLIDFVYAATEARWAPDTLASTIRDFSYGRRPPQTAVKQPMAR
jgi:hypothetical protein